MATLPAHENALSDRWRRWIRVTRRGALLLSLTAVAVDGVAVTAGGDVRATYLALAVSACGALLGLRRPAWGLILSLAGFVLAIVVGVDVTTEWTIVVFTLLSATLAGVPPVRSGIAVAAALYGALVVSEKGGALTPVAITAASAAAAAAAIGGGVRAQWRYLVLLEEQASDAVAAGQRASAQALVEERLRIARDLHDVIGHEVAVLNMHLGVAEVSLPPGTDLAAAELAAARLAVQSVLTQTQQILELLRRGDADPRAASAPTPGPGDLDGLLESFRRIGVEVEVDLRPLAGSVLTPTVGVTLYRVVQEALTNAQRYGDGATHLTLTRAPGKLIMTVTNLRSSDPERVPEGRGYGLLGMRERLTAVGGDLKVTSDDMSFQLTATLPASEGTTP